MKRYVPRNFRPWPEVQKRLEFANEVGLNVSEIINEVLLKHSKPIIEEKIKKIQNRLAAPVP